MPVAGIADDERDPPALPDRRPAATVGTMAAGVGIDVADAAFDGAAGIAGCSAPESSAARRARAVSRLDLLMSALFLDFDATAA